MSAFDLAELRQAFGTFMTGVTVVTTVSDEGIPVGFTANSFTSVSLDPPLLLVCPAQALASFEIFRQCRKFALSILAEDQQDIANVFASAGGDRFARVAWRADAAGCPVIEGNAAAFSCSTHHGLPAGDHLILIGHIESLEISGKAGLGYANGGYFSIGLERRAAELLGASATVTVGAIIEHDGKVLLTSAGEGLCPPAIEATSRTGALAAIRVYLEAAGLDVEFGPVYSIFEDSRTSKGSIYYRGTATHGDASKLGQFIDIGDFPKLEFANSAIGDMLNRYALERRNGVFCLYLGDDVAGEVHMFGEIASS